MSLMIRKIISISIFVLLLQVSTANAGTTGSEELKSTDSQNTADECFEGFSRAMFELNHDLDKIILSFRAGRNNIVSSPARSSSNFKVQILKGP